MEITETIKKDFYELVLSVAPKYVQERYSYIGQETNLSFYEIYEKSRLGIITNATYGVNDKNNISLGLNIALDESSGCSVLISIDIATELLLDYDVKDVKDLIGKPIKVLSIPTDNRIFWLEACKIELKR